MNKIIKSPIISLDAYNIDSDKGETTKLKGRAFCSLTYRKEGLVKIKTDEASFLSSEDCITFVPKYQDYSTQIVCNTKMIAIHFDYLGENMLMFKKPFVFKNSNQHLKQLFELVFETYTIDDTNNYECYSHFYRLLFEIEKILRKNKEEKEKIIPAVIKAKTIIEKNFSNNNFNIDSLVASLSISAAYLRREFKKAYSVTPIEYLKYVRHQKAVSLLSSEYYTIEKIAKECGYGSMSYFIQTFKKTTGFSPKKFILKKNK